MAKKNNSSKEVNWSSQDTPKPQSQGESIKESNTTSERGSATTVKKSKSDK